MDVEHYFHRRAEAIETIDRGRHYLEACILASSALDALGEIWFHDFPNDKAALDRAAGGKCPSSIRMAELVIRYSGDAVARNVAVVLFAQDLKTFRSDRAAEANALLATRVGGHPAELPRRHRDVDVNALAAEAPNLFSDAFMTNLAKEYQYPALVYSLYRCPTTHEGMFPPSVHGFVDENDIRYWWGPADDGRRIVQLGFGIGVLRRWITQSATGYARACADAGVEPAHDFTAGGQWRSRMAGLWNRLGAS